MAPPLKRPKSKLPSLHGRLMVDTVNGKVRIRKWPAKRGPIKSQQQLIQTERFTAAQKLYPQLKGSVANHFIRATLGTGLYPRDLFMKMMTTAPIAFTDENGVTLRYGRPRLENSMFQGLILRLTSNFAYGAGAFSNVIWPAPILDTSGMFSAAAPDRITIPSGVTVVTMFAGWRRSASAGNFLNPAIQRLGGAEDIRAEQSLNSGAGGCIVTGPMIVSEGEQYAFSMFGASSGTTLAGRTFFAVEILAAEV